MSKKIKSITNPKLKLEILTPAEVKQIHEATLWIIEKVGVRFPSEKALKVWEASGAEIDWDRRSSAQKARSSRRRLRNARLPTHCRPATRNRICPSTATTSSSARTAAAWK